MRSQVRKRKVLEDSLWVEKPISLGIFYQVRKSIHKDQKRLIFSSQFQRFGCMVIWSWWFGDYVNADCLSWWAAQGRKTAYVTMIRKRRHSETQGLEE